MWKQSSGFQLELYINSAKVLLCTFSSDICLCSCSFEITCNWISSFLDISFPCGFQICPCCFVFFHDLIRMDAERGKRSKPLSFIFFSFLVPFNSFCYCTCFSLSHCCKLSIASRCRAITLNLNALLLY